MDLALIEAYVQEQLAHETTGHDVQHVKRVVTNAVRIAHAEVANSELEIIQAAAWLHDVVDDKVVDDVEAAIQAVADLLQRAGASAAERDEVLDIIEHQSFSKNLTTRHALSRAGQIVQDADRLDAMGAIGLLRTAYYGGVKAHVLYNNAPPRDLTTLSPLDYRVNSSVIGHVYEKLLRLEGLMNTATARRIARQRTQFMEDFLAEFWEEVKVVEDEEGNRCNESL